MGKTANPSPDDSFDNQERKALLEELQRTQLAYQMASEMSQFKAGFLARISHEIRSPLNGLIGLHQLILADLCESPEEEREFVGQANTAALKLIKLLDDILEISRTEHGINQLKIQPLSLSEILTEIQHLTSLQAANRNLPLQIQLPEPDLFVLADHRWLVQVLLNLVDTPLNLMGKAGEGSLTLSTQPSDEHYAKLWIEDLRPAAAWAEPLDRMQSSTQKIDLPKAAATAQVRRESFCFDTPQTLRELAPSLSLVSSQSILELMNGRLEILLTPAATATEASDIADRLTRIQCSIPLASAATTM